VGVDAREREMERLCPRRIRFRHEFDADVDIGIRNLAPCAGEALQHTRLNRRGTGANRVEARLIFSRGRRKCDRDAVVGERIAPASRQMHVDGDLLGRELDQLEGLRWRGTGQVPRTGFERAGESRFQAPRARVQRFEFECDLISPDLISPII
jgi:hypothetical protein